MRKMVFEHRLAFRGIIAALAAGGLEAAWTRPDFGGPANTLLGCVSILVILLLVTWPRIWFIPALAIIEEAVQGFVGTAGVWHPTTQTLFHHWSVEFLGGVNLYPWITFPLLTLAGVLLHLVWRKRLRESDSGGLNGRMS